jgi:hypothetical protein
MPSDYMTDDQRFAARRTDVLFFPHWARSRFSSFAYKLNIHFPKGNPF